MNQDDILKIIKKLGGHATVPQMRDYVKKRDPESHMLKDPTYFHNKLALLQRKWGLIGAKFNRSLGSRGLQIYYLKKDKEAGRSPPKSPPSSGYPYFIIPHPRKPRSCTTAASVIRDGASTSVSPAKPT